MAGRRTPGPLGVGKTGITEFTPPGAGFSIPGPIGLDLGSLPRAIGGADATPAASRAMATAGALHTLAALRVRAAMQQQRFDELPLVSRGDRNEWVGEVQQAVNRLKAIPAPLAIDGIFGPLTMAAVQAVQRGAGLKQDGIVGPRTWPVLLRRRQETGGTPAAAEVAPAAPRPSKPMAPPPKGAAPPPCASDFVLSPCRIVKAKGSLQIAASESGGAPAGAYEWTTSSAKITIDNPTSSTVTVKALDQVSASREAETITVTRKQDGCPPVVKVVKVTVAKVTFSASASQRYGYDNFDTPADPLDDHICIKRSDYTSLHVKIEGGAVGTDFDFVCDDATVCTAVPPGATAEFDLRLNAAAENKKDTDLHAKVKCPTATSFTHIKVHVYKEKAVDVVVAKFDKTTAGTNLRFPTADYAAHATLANAKLKEAVVKYNITNFDPGNAVTPVNLLGGAATVTFDIKSGGGADLTAIGAAMTGTGTKVRVAIIRDMKSVYFLSAAAAKGATTLVVTAASTFFKVGNTPPVGTGANRETITITALAGNTITCAALKKAHAVGETIEFPAAGWSSDPILIIEGSAALDVTKWTVLHEVGHRALTLADIIDTTDFMHFSQDWTDYRLRYCPRKKSYPAGTTATENQWETIPRT